MQAPDQGGPRSAGEELDAWEARTTEREIDALSAVHEAVAGFARPEGLEAPAELDASSRARIIRVAVAEAQKCSAAWTRAALLWELHRAMPAMAAGVDQAALAEELADEALASGEVAGRSARRRTWSTCPSLGVRASDGRSVFTPPGTERYTTAAWLDLEEYLVAEARREVPQLVTPAQAAGRAGRRGPGRGPGVRWPPGCWPRGPRCRCWWPRPGRARPTPWPRSPGPGRAGPAAG